MLTTALLLVTLQGAAPAAGADTGAVTAASGVAARGRADDSLPTISLAEAVRRSNHVDPSAVAARGLVGTTAWGRRAALAALVTPTVSVGGDYTSVTPKTFNFAVLPPTTNANAFRALPLSSHTSDANVTATYTAFNGGQNISRLRAARFNEASAAANDDAVRSSSRVATETAYYTVIADQELLRVAEERVRNTLQQLTVSRARVASGAAVETDSLQVVLQLNTAQVALLRQQAATRVDRLALGRRVGLSAPIAAQPVDTLPPPELPFTADQAVSQALQTGPSYIRARAGERAAGAAVAAQTGGFLPTVTLSASRLAYGDQAFANQLYRNQFAIGVSFPILDQGQREYAVAVANASLDSARAVRADLERGARQEVTNAYEAYNTARATAALQQTGVAVAHENLRVETLRYQAGTENILNLLTAQLSLTEAESDLVNARKTARLALATLQALLGKQLVPEEGAP